MKSLSRQIRAVVALVAIVALSLGAASAAVAAPKRTADTTTYTSASYLQSALGLPAKQKHVIESVTYDRFQWLLGQPGTFAFLIGDPATDPTFAARAQDVEAAAAAAGVKQVYWFNPNLSGSAKVGNVTLPNLDIRNAAGITSLAAAKADVFERTWQVVVARHLGNGLEPTGGTGTANVSDNPAWVNDYGVNAGYSTEVGNASGGALYRYVNKATRPADVQDSFFFVYDKDRTVTVSGTPQKSKVVAWTNLTEQASSASAQADVTTAVATRGGAAITAVDEFAWWKSSAAARQASTPVFEGRDIPALTDADGADWRVHQVTYPELIHLLDTESSKEVVLLLGGTWCPNTRPVLSTINKQAQDNDVTVFNFDTILDGGLVGGNIGANPLQSRNPAANGGFINANPSFVFGELVARYLNNLKTENLPTASNKITYYPGGDTTQPLTSQPRLQVPYLVGYQGKAGDEPHGGVTRQWIHTKPDGTFTEYMSLWQWVNPQPFQLGIDPAALPHDAAIWSTLNSQLAAFTWQTDPQTLKVNPTAVDDAAKYLGAADKAKVTFTAPDTVTVSSSTANDAIPISPAALASALTDLGASAPTSYATARSALVAAENATPRNEPLIADLQTVFGAWDVVSGRKNTVNEVWGNAGEPRSVAGGAAAVRAAVVFFAGIPDRPAPVTPTQPQPVPVQSKPAVSTPAPKPAVKTTKKAKVRKLAGSIAKAPTSRRGGRFTVKITVPKGARTATGKVTLKLKKGSRTRTFTGTLKNGVVTIALPKLAKGTWKVTIAWRGDARYAAASSTGTLKVRK